MKLATGDRLGPYEILTPIGAGGMGEVYRARDVRLGREVAVKVLPEAFVRDAERLARFQLEAKALAALNHPNICTLYDVGPDYLVMEYVEGQPIRGPLTIEEALRAAIQIGRALASAHGRGIVHRDLKPGNVLVTGEGRIKLLDFGLAKFSAHSPAGDATVTMGHTLPGTVMGTVAYMSPEQAAGGEIDARSDMFSFGAVFYELLTGRRAFDGGSPAATLAAVLKDPPVPPREYGCAVPTGVEELVFRCLEKKPERRWASMAAVVEELERPAARSGARPEAAGGLAVLPFANLSPDPENGYFSDGLTDEIINLLTRVSGLRVIARTSAFTFKERNCPLREAAEALKVSYVLEGGVRKAGNRIRVTAQLVRAEDETPLWSGRWDRELTDIFVIQDEIADAIGEALQIRLAGEVRPGRVTPTRNLEAHKLYLRGVHHVCQWETGLAQSCFERAVELDSGFAPAGTQLANLMLGLVSTGVYSPREVFPRARDYLNRALAADPMLADAHSSLALIEAVHDFDWEAAERRFRRAIELNPQSPWPHHHYGYALMYQGRMEPAQQALRRTIHCDPLAAIHRSLFIVMLIYTADFQEAAGHCRDALRMLPEAWFAKGGLGWCSICRGRLEEGIRLMEEAVEASPGVTWLNGWLVKAYADAGRPEQAQSVIDRALRRSIGDPPRSMTAAMYAAVGQTSRALELLEQAVELREPQLTLLAKDPVYEQLREDGRYAAVRQKMNLPSAG